MIWGTMTIQRYLIQCTRSSLCASHAHLVQPRSLVGAARQDSILQQGRHRRDVVLVAKEGVDVGARVAVEVLQRAVERCGEELRYM